MENSDDMQKARQLLQNSKEQTFSNEQRREFAVELAGLMLRESRRVQTYGEKCQQRQLARMMNDPSGKSFFTSVTDQCFRSNNNARVADQLVFLIKKFGLPGFLSPFKRFQFLLFRYFGRPFSGIAVPLVKRILRKEMSNVILPGEPEQLSKHLEKRRKDRVQINLNILGEAILGEEDADRRLKIYLNNLLNPSVEYVSIKISTIFSQISLLGQEDTLSKLEQRLKQLYRAAKSNFYTLPNGSRNSKFVNLDMEEYRDLHLTVSLFKNVLDNEEFFGLSAGIVLQAYLPDAYMLQQELTLWAMQRVGNGGAPIKIRLVKGANLAMEQVEAALKGWPQAPYHTKVQADANFKRMLLYACEPERVKAVKIGVGSHNLFDIAYALLMRAEKGIENDVSFEMLEGMADHIRRVVQALSGGMLLYCPVATKDDFQNAVAYLMRRLDENTAPDNFLRHAFEMFPGTSEWQGQADLFSNSCHDLKELSSSLNRKQSRIDLPVKTDSKFSFKNEPDTDWALAQNVKWAEAILEEWSNKTHPLIPLVIGGQEVASNLQSEGKKDPSYPERTLYGYVLGWEMELERLISAADEALKNLSTSSMAERLYLLDEAAYQLRCRRSDLIGSMVADTAKTVAEADVEVSEAIDFAMYYRKSMEELLALKDIEWKAKGIVLVAPPWNFPCSIPAGGILGALAAGNAVIFKPAPEAILVGWHLVNALWDAGISREVLQFFCCTDDPVGTCLIKDTRISVVILTGATTTAKTFIKLRPDLDLIAETGGKNALIITCMADRDLAIKDLLQSAFGHAGQKCSACSLAILEKEIYDDPHFKRQLHDAAASLRVGLPWDLSTKVNPLIRKPSSELLRGLTSLEAGEEWLLEPRQDGVNPNLWSPGIKLGVKAGSFMHQTELFGPVLALMRANDLQEAVEWANGTSYGLTAGIHTLDEREQKFWAEHIIAGNCYINRTITGAIVQRQPFGGCKESSFGPGAKAGGPNYLVHLMQPKAIALPLEREPATEAVMKLNQTVQQMDCGREELESWSGSIGSYAFYWNHNFSKMHDPSGLKGQDNILYYVPLNDLVLRVEEGDGFLDVLKVIAAGDICGVHLEISKKHGKFDLFQNKCLKEIASVSLVEESEEQFVNRLRSGLVKKVRYLSKPSPEIYRILAEAACHFNVAPVLANGRVELLNYLREVSLSVDYHRYGYIGL